MSTIKFKRGNKANLATLNAGEIAFTLDSKELFIGDGTTNYNFSPINKNLLTNSNFQVPLAATDTDNTGLATIAPKSGRYMYGNYYINNASNGQLVTFSPKDSSGRMTIACSYTIPIIEYRLKLPRYQVNSSFGYSSPLENRTLTLSYDFKNLTSTYFTIFSGQPADLKSLIVPPGLSRQSATFTFNKYTIQGSLDPCMDIIIVKSSVDISYSFELGNIKLEVGPLMTPYYANSLGEDISQLALSYRVINQMLRATFVTANTIEFHMLNDRFATYDYGGKYNIISSTIFSTTGITQTAFSFTVTQDANYKTIKIIATKNAHGLNDATLMVKLEVDYRP